MQMFVAHPQVGTSASSDKRSRFCPSYLALRGFNPIQSIVALFLNFVAIAG